MHDIGIYKITNTVDDKFYIGSSINLTKRIYLHRNQLDLGRHRNSHLQRAWDKHGAAAFEFSVLERVERGGELLKIEQRWLDESKAVELGYNICPTAQNRLGVKATQETKARMAASQVGKHHTAETRAKMSASKAGAKKPPRSPEHREKLGAAHRNKTVSDETRAKLRAAWVLRKQNQPEGMKSV